MVKETELYDLLGVEPTADDIVLKKAYRKMAIKYHPDKNSSEEAEAIFKSVSEAYQILSDPDTRAFYDRYGKAKLTEVAGEPGMQDPFALFGSLFGGERFNDLIGEISLVKDFASTMDVYMTDEERAEMEAEMAVPGSSSSGDVAGGGTDGIPVDPLASKTSTTGVPGGETAEPTAVPTASASATTHEPAPSPTTHAADHNGHLTLHTPGASTPSPSGTSTPTATHKKKDDKVGAAATAGKSKLSPEQKAKLAALEAEKEKARQERVDTLVKNLIARIRPFVEAKHPGDAQDPETIAFEKRTRLEAEDLKLESFGVELLHTIGNVYIQKSTTFVKSKKFLGGGFFSRLKEKGTMLKEGWGVLGSAIGVQMAMEEMMKIEAKGDASQEELDALAADLSSKLLLTTWKGTRWEIISVLGEVVDRVLYEPGLPKEVALNRAKAIMTVGGVFKATIPDESDEERRELERLVLNAGSKKKARDKKAKEDKEKAAHGGGGLFGWGRAKEKEAPPAAHATGTTPEPEKA